MDLALDCGCGVLYLGDRLLDIRDAVADHLLDICDAVAVYLLDMRIIRLMFRSLLV